MKDIKYHNLEEKPELYKETIDLIEKSFNYSKDNSYEIDFAPLVHQTNRSNCHVMVHEDKIIGHIGARRVEFGTKASSFPLVMLGGICIDEEFRGKGLFTPFIDKVLNLYKDAALFSLWSDKSEFYEKFSFHQAGGQVIVESKGTPTGPTEGPYKFSELSMEDISQMMMIYDDFSEDKWTIQRDMSDWEVLKSIESASIHFIPSRLEPHGYTIAEKGQDLSGITHEVCFYEGLFDRFQDHLSTKKAWLAEGTTEGDTSLYTAFFKVGDYQKFAQMVYTLSGDTLAISSITDSIIQFGFNGDSYEASHEEFFRYLFGPSPLEDFKTFAKPIVISGLDSI
ncbi:MAG: GNAT family N-acetyltransferase [Bacteriovoracaceae bacterium]|nr:GNAT family N-acetyltransferase [Bacteriovoracaceae bacterium]